MSLKAQLESLATRIATVVKGVKTQVNGNAADLTGLDTSTKTHLVAAINEVLGVAQAAANSGGATIDDSATAATKTWSSSKIDEEVGSRITAAVNGLVDGAPGALDTLNELAAALGDDEAFQATVTTALGNRVRFDAAQSLTAAQKTQACVNIGVGEPETDFVAVFNAGL